MLIHEAAAKGFAAGADAYERGRPEYSAAAIAKLVEELRIGPGTRVLDLAAGTGKLTRALLPSGAELVAVEPIPEMRAKLEASAPGVEAIDGTAERIPLPNHSVDAVVVGQAFHWFDGVRATSEIRRVLRPGGAVGIISQARDAKLPWIVRLNEIIDAAADGQPRFREGAWRDAFDTMALFEPLQTAAFDHVQRGSVETIVDRVASISYIAAMPDEGRCAVLDEVRRLLADDADTTGKDVIELPYKAEVFWTRPRETPLSPTKGLLVSINISPGGVPKLPIASGHLGPRGVEGDRHSKPEPIHGTPEQAACLLAIEAMERIRADGHDAFPGAYGENFTIAGLDWASLRAGQHLRIGASGPLLELTEYATPCDTQKRWFLRGRTGRMSARRYPQDVRWYAAVLEAGPVAAGNPVEVVAKA